MKRVRVPLSYPAPDDFDGASGSLPGWQLCRGISGSFRVEWVAGFVWNQWQPWSGIRNSGSSCLRRATSSSLGEPETLKALSVSSSAFSAPPGQQIRIDANLQGYLATIHTRLAAHGDYSLALIDIGLTCPLHCLSPTKQTKARASPECRRSSPIKNTVRIQDVGSLLIEAVHFCPIYVHRMKFPLQKKWSKVLS